MKTFGFTLVLSIFFVSAFAQEKRAVFTYEHAGAAGKSGHFSFYDENDKQLFSTSASAGYKDDAQNPYSQGLKNKGPIPGGTWYITAIKDNGKTILRLEPGDDVLVKHRDGFLIHGFGEGNSPEEASKGCIILSKSYREILRDAFISGGNKKIKIYVMPVDSSTGG
jgi:hypothetical protein